MTIDFTEGTAAMLAGLAVLLPDDDRVRGLVASARQEETLTDLATEYACQTLDALEDNETALPPALRYADLVALACTYVHSIAEVGSAPASTAANRALRSAFVHRLSTAADPAATLTLLGMVHDAARFAVRRARAIHDGGGL